MNFLNSAILLALSAAILPLLIHLFTRAKAKTIPFSTLKFLKELQQNKIKRIKIRQILLLLLRTLIVILLVLGFARPTCRTNPSHETRANAKTSAVFILDHSASMACSDHGMAAQKKALQNATSLLDAMQPGDEIFLVNSTDTSLTDNRRAFHDINELRLKLEQIPPDARRTNLSASMQFAENLLAGAHNANKEIFLISDLQATAFRADSFRMIADVRRFAFPIRHGTVTNLAVSNVQLASSILQKDKLVELEVTLNNFEPIAVSNRLVQIFVNGKQVAQNVVGLAPGASTTDVFTFNLEKTGLISGYVQLEDDDLKEDNRRYFSFHVPDEIRIGLVGGETVDGALLQLALKPQPAGISNFRIRPFTIDRLAYLPLDDLDIVILNNCAVIPAVLVQRLLPFIEAGGGLVLVLGNQVDVKSYNQGLASALGLPAIFKILTTPDQNSAFSLGRADILHPIFSGIFEKNEARIGDPRFHFAVLLQQAVGATPIIQFSSGDPYLVEVRRGPGAALIFASGFDLNAGDIAYRAIFAPLIHRSVAYLSSHGQREQAAILAGDPLNFRLPTGNVNANLVIQRPDGREDRVQPQIRPSGAWIEYAATEKIGVYRLLADQVALAHWAVNMDMNESDLRPLAEDELQIRYGTKIVPQNLDARAYILQQRKGREIWKYFLIAALLFLIVEMLLYREKGELRAIESGSIR